MKPVAQTQFQGKVGAGAGNCHAACVASLLERLLEDVPNFQEIEDDDERWKAEAEWYRTQGLFAICTTPNGDLDRFAGWHIAIGPNVRNGILHSCVYYGEELRHDPHPAGGGLAEVQYRVFLIPQVLPL